MIAYKTKNDCSELVKDIRILLFSKTFKDNQNKQKTYEIRLFKFIIMNKPINGEWIQ